MMKKLNPFTKIVSLAMAGAMVAFFAFAGDAHKSAAKTESAAAAAYPIDFCIVSGEKLGSMGDPIVRTYEGREVQFCCAGCIGRFEKDQATYFKKLDDAVAAASTKTEAVSAVSEYPIDYCIVSGEPLGTMGDPVKVSYEGREVQFCCNNCVKAFNKAPEKFIAKLDEAAAKAGKSEAPSESHDGHGHEGHQH